MKMRSNRGTFKRSTKQDRNFFVLFAFLAVKKFVLIRVKPISLLAPLILLNFRVWVRVFGAFRGLADLRFKSFLTIFNRDRGLFLETFGGFWRLLDINRERGGPKTTSTSPQP